MQTAIVTGATAGIGEAIAHKLASMHYQLIITGRRNEKLQSLKKELHHKYGVTVLTLCFDIRNREAVQQAIQTLPDAWKDIDILVNNAGLAAGLDPIQTGNIDDWEQMIDTNIKGLLYMTRQISSFMIQKQKGQIINIGSIAGKEVYPNGTVYCATKHAVDALNKGMRIDMHKHNIKVTAINPGMVETEFSLVRFKGNTEKAQTVYKGFQALLAQDIADTLEFVVTRPEHVNINDIIIMPSAQATATIINKN